MKKGLIFDIKEYAIFDGPGIRETVFFKGCPLRCVWCHNPEGLRRERELTVARASCLNCGKCKEVCSKTECSLCGKCISVCPRSLRKICGQEISASELAKRLLSHSEYYSSLGGGFTFSGGEPLFQHEFLFEVLDLLNGDHRIVETSAYASNEVFIELLKRCEMVIMDIKLIDRDLHKKYTGVYNDSIISNYKILVKESFPHIIRMPLIPNVTDTLENTKGLASLLKNDSSLEMLELLPYHITAGAKYENVGMKYDPPFDTTKEITVHKEIFEKENIRYRVL